MPQNSFDPKSVAFAIITFYPKWYKGPLRSIKHTEKVRGDLALEFLQTTKNAGYNVICVDGQSANSFHKELDKIIDLKVLRRRTPGRGVNKRQAIRYVSKIADVKVIVLTEPEKLSLLTDCLEQIVSPILSGNADIVVPRRRDDLFKASYPAYMYQSEVEGNKIYNEALRSHGVFAPDVPDFDFFFGPRVFRNEPKIVSLFMKRYSITGGTLLESLFDPDSYSNILNFPIITAVKNKLRVADVEIPFVYPKIQKENEEVGAREMFVLKRNEQRVNFLIGLMHFLTYLDRKKSTKLKLEETV
jgi:hypothetical protein